MRKEKNKKIGRQRSYHCANPSGPNGNLSRKKQKWQDGKSEKGGRTVTNEQLIFMNVFKYLFFLVLLVFVYFSVADHYHCKYVL